MTVNTNRVVNASEEEEEEVVNLKIYKNICYARASVYFYCIMRLLVLIISKVVKTKK